MKDLIIETIKTLPMPAPIMPTRIPTSNIVILLIFLVIVIVFYSILSLKKKKDNESKKPKS